MSEERWLPVVGAEDEYEVSDLGRVRSLDRWVTKSSKVVGSYRQWRKGKLLKARTTSSGHSLVYIGTFGRNYLVHRLVLEAFRGKAPAGFESLHRNGKPTDCRLENLRWGSRADNVRDVKHHAGRSDGKLRPDDIRDIRGRIGSGEPIREIAVKFGVHRSLIYQIRRGDVHTDV
jgi:hypothetical protein